ncbi:hypothetical protein NL676_003478 [Syzygium grande]|nr:hypothetical protein NL676_003478 [Syzygium grande]
MAMRASSAAAATSRVSCALSKPAQRPQLLRPISVSLPTSTTLSLFALFSPPHEARAVSFPKDQIVSSITEVEKTIDQVQEMSRLRCCRKLENRQSRLLPQLFLRLRKKAQEAMQSSGIDAQPVMSAAKTVADAVQQTTKLLEEAKPIASSAVETISSADPTVIFGTAGALFVAYLIVPPIWSAISFSFRGYQGNLTPAQTLDLISTKSHILIDIRSEKEKDKAGVPRLPSSAKNRMIAIPLEELPSKLRGLVRNVKKVEAEIAALKISYHKKIDKGSNIVILDTYSDSAKIVARMLTSLGFKNCWIVADGFSGRNGWLQSRLGTDSYNFLFAEVLSPSRVIPATVRRFGTTISSGGKLLPGSK